MPQHQQTRAHDQVLRSRRSSSYDPDPQVERSRARYSHCRTATQSSRVAAAAASSSNPQTSIGQAHQRPLQPLTNSLTTDSPRIAATLAANSTPGQRPCLSPLRSGNCNIASSSTPEWPMPALCHNGLPATARTHTRGSLSPCSPHSPRTNGDLPTGARAAAAP